MGGGKSNFKLEKNGGVRQDRDLLEIFQSNGGTLLSNFGDLDNWSMDDKTLGVFNEGHMEWEMYRARNQGPSGEPSLSQMTKKAIQKLSASSAENGFVLIVEGGRIDHGHHMNQAKKAVTETIELENAVKVALDMTDDDDTLIIVTADHSHAVTFNGYADRGNPILGTYMDLNKKRYISLNWTHPTPTPYTTISYANGPGFSFHYNSTTGSYNDLTSVDTNADEFQQMSTFYLDYETHGGEDVPLYATGPQAHLLSGVHEQSYVNHVMSYAACLHPSREIVCPPATASGAVPVIVSLSSLVVAVILVYSI